MVARKEDLKAKLGRLQVCEGKCGEDGGVWGGCGGAEGVELMAQAAEE